MILENVMFSSMISIMDTALNSYVLAITLELSELSSGLSSYPLKSHELTSYS